ncbi:MAG: ABC transporter substrate-binding protein, partial [Deinococcota bacterium]
ASPWPPEAPELYGSIAPVVVIDMFEQPLEDALFQFANLVNRTERAEQLQAELEARAAEVREQLGEALETTTISILTYAEEDSQFYPTNPTQAMGVILRTLEPIRPAPERGLTDQREYRSMETIGDHAADVMFQLVFDADDRGDSDAFTAFTSESIVSVLPVAQEGQIYPLNGSTMVGSGWGKVMNGLEQIASVLLQDDLNRDLVQE